MKTTAQLDRFASEFAETSHRPALPAAQPATRRGHLPCAAGAPGGRDVEAEAQLFDGPAQQPNTASDEAIARALQQEERKRTRGGGASSSSAMAAGGSSEVKEVTSAEMAAAVAEMAVPSSGPKPEWFSNARMPQFVVRKPPQQKNEYDCGLYMLHFIEKICSNDLPSFKSADEIFAHFHRGGGAHFEKEEIETKRTDFHRVLAAMARAAKVDLHPEDDHEGDHESE